MTAQRAPEYSAGRSGSGTNPRCRTLPSLARTRASSSARSTSRTGPASTSVSGRERSRDQAAKASISAPRFLRGSAPPTCST